MIPHILLTDKKEKAEKFIKSKLDTSIQFFEIFPEGESIKIEQIRKLRKALALHFEKRICVILWWFDKATIEAQNASLKMLEEYSSKIDFFLIVQNTNKLLPTILSRAVIKDIRERSLDNLIKKSKFDLNKFWPNVKNKDQAIEILNSLLFYFREKYKKIFDLKSAEFVKEILKVLDLLENNNLDPQLSIDYILIFYRKKFNIKK